MQLLEKETWKDIIEHIIVIVFGHIQLNKNAWDMGLSMMMDARFYMFPWQNSMCGEFNNHYHHRNGYVGL